MCLVATYGGQYEAKQCVKIFLHFTPSRGGMTVQCPDLVEGGGGGMTIIYKITAGEKKKIYNVKSPNIVNVVKGKK